MTDDDIERIEEGGTADVRHATACGSRIVVGRWNL